MERSLTFLLTIVVAFTLVVSSVPVGGEGSPQAAFVASFADGLEEGLAHFGLADYLEQPLRYELLDELFAAADDFDEAREALLDLAGQDPQERGFTPQNMLAVLGFFPGFDEVEAVLTTDVVLDFLSAPGVDFLMMMVLEYALADLGMEPEMLFAMANLAGIFGLTGLAQDLIPADVPAIEFFDALDYVAGDGFADSLLNMEVNTRFAHMGAVFAELLMDVVMEYEAYIFEAIELLEQFGDFDFEQFAQLL